MTASEEAVTAVAVLESAAATELLPLAALTELLAVPTELLAAEASAQVTAVHRVVDTV